MAAPSTERESRTARGVAARLAALARDVRERARAALGAPGGDEPLQRLFAAYREAVPGAGRQADDFADACAQALVCGLVSAAAAGSPDAAAASPLLAELRAALPTGGVAGLDALGDLAAGGQGGEDPVVHLYERFLAAWDGRRRAARGVYDTPRAVVAHVVRSVDERLRLDFGLEDGLASTATWGALAARHPALRLPDGVGPDEPFVQVLDPATGSGTFLAEVVRVVHRTLHARWQREGGPSGAEERWQRYVPRHLLPRLHGFELLLAPCAIAPVTLAQALRETGYALRPEDRAPIYLTDALAPPREGGLPPATTAPALARGAAAADEVKRRTPVTVVVGNPPWAYRSANLTPAARDRVARFRAVAGERIRERSALSLERSLQDDLVKFLGLALDLRDRVGGAFVLGLVTNSSWLDSVLHRGVRDQLLRSFRTVHVVDLGGDAIRDREENVFAIRQGAALLVAAGALAPGPADVAYRAVRGTRADKLAALEVGTAPGGAALTPLNPAPPLCRLVPAGDAPEYDAWSPLDAVFEQTSTGIKTLKDRLATGPTPAEVLKKIEDFCDPRRDARELAAAYGVRDVVQWRVAPARAAVRRLADRAAHVVPYQARPFDERWMFYHPAVVGSPRTPVLRHLRAPGNLALVANRRVRTGACHHLWVVSALCASEIISSADNANVFPLWLRPPEGAPAGKRPRPNLRPEFLRRLAAALGRAAGPDGLPAGVSAEDVLAWCYGVGHSPRYRERYAHPLAAGFPRIPLPGTPALFAALAALGHALVAVHLLRAPAVQDPPRRFVGGQPLVEHATWESAAVWLDRARTAGFRPVPRPVWEHPIGSYRVCAKWLKDREGRTLSAAEVRHYERILAAVEETQRLAAEVDRAIAAHGGWPGAFAR